MKLKTRTSPDASEFCLVLTPTAAAASRASGAVKARLTLLEEATRRDLAAVVGELVQNAVERRPGTPITVSVAVVADTVRGEVADQGGIASFEIPLAR
jgi:anti-sigma regulatory factor (Ser/Thr protein kinase)